MRRLWIVLFFHSFCVFAQNSPVPLRFQKVTTEQGLPHNFVHSVTQDRNGFIWIGTNYGLARYDGYSFKVFIPEVNNPYSITHKPIGITFIDSENNLWLSINSGGVNKMNLDTEHFTGYFTDNTTNYFIAGDDKRFFEDAEKRIWLITRSGIFLYDKQNDELICALSDDRFYKSDLISTRFADDGKGNIWFVYDGNVFILNKNTLVTQVFDLFIDDPALQSYYYQAIASSNNGMIWLLSYDDGLVHYNSQTKKSNALLKNKLNLRDIFIDKKGHVYVLSDDDQLALHVLPHGDFKTNEFSSFTLPEVDIQTHGFNFAEDNYGNVYISGGCGISIYNSNTGSIAHYNQNSGLIDNSIKNIFIDRTENLWLCVTRKGINKADLMQKPFRIYVDQSKSLSHPVQDNTVLSVFEDSKCNLWVASSDDGVLIYNKDRSKSVRFYLNANEPVMSIYEDIDGTVLLGTYLSVVYRVDSPDLKSFEGNSKEKFSVKQNYNYHNVRKIVADDSTNLWFASGNGLVEWNRARNEFTNFSMLYDSLNFFSSFYRTVYVAKDQSVWTGSNSGGLCRFDQSNLIFKHYLHDTNNPKSISNNTVYAIHEDQEGFLWVGTGQGLEKFNPRDETFERASVNDDLFQRSIFSILTDSCGNFWMSTEKVLIKYNKNNYQIESYGQADGLQYNEFSTTASYRSISGELYYGGVAGLVSFIPEKLKQNLLHAKPVITNFLLKNRIISPGDSVNGRVLLAKQITETEEITLSYHEADFTIEFSALHFASPKKNTFQYMLEGFNNDWVNVNASKRYATYTGLPPGNYTFYLRASNNDGVMSLPEDQVQLSIIIVPPFWKTVWFRILIVAILIGFVFLYTKYRVRSLKELNALLDKKVIERTHALEEANVILEESQEEISQQNEEILAQYKSLEEQQKLIVDQNSELYLHRNKLELLIDERTIELEKALVKAEESERLKTSFLMNMSHEIRTPMNSIIGFSSLLVKETKIEKRKRFNNIINASGRTLLSLINDILDISHIEAKQVSLFSVGNNLSDLLTELYEVFKIEADNKNISFKLSIAAIEPDFTMQYDEIRLKQVLTNLLSNAIKFTSSGEIEFGIVGIENVITFFVKDTGIGISSIGGKSVFNRFYKIEDNKSHLFRGTGLGLAISKSLVSLWEGKIWFESEPGKGTTFFFTHPVVKAEMTKLSGKSTNKQVQMNLKGYRILIAEDEESNFQLLKEILSQTEVEIFWAKDGLEAVEFVTNNQCDIVLMDIKMPVMNGIEATRKIKKINPEIPIIAQTAFAFSNEIDQILQSGCDSYLTKPIDRDRLLSLINQFVNNEEE